MQRKEGLEEREKGIMRIQVHRQPPCSDLHTSFSFLPSIGLARRRGRDGRIITALLPLAVLPLVERRFLCLEVMSIQFAASVAR